MIYFSKSVKKIGFTAISRKKRGLSEVIPKFRALVKGFGGIVSMKTFQCIEQQGVYYDHVVWENHEFALSAAKKFEEFQQKGENLELISWFEEVKFMDHFKQVA